MRWFIFRIRYYTAWVFLLIGYSTLPPGRYKNELLKFVYDLNARVTADVRAMDNKKAMQIADEILETHSETFWKLRVSELEDERDRYLRALDAIIAEDDGNPCLETVLAIARGAVAPDDK